MSTLYITRGQNIVVDTETNDVNRLDSERQGIDRIYIADKPMHVIYGCGEKHCEADVEKDDIIVVFYAETFDNPMIIVKNEDWKNNLIEYRKKEQEEKERWAASKCCGEECTGKEL